jgi:hypothetical protein
MVGYWNSSARWWGVSDTVTGTLVGSLFPYTAPGETKNTCPQKQHTQIYTAVYV